MRSLIQLPSGLHLEASLDRPRESLSNGATELEVTKLAVCLHPWSWLGGRMSDPVLRDISEALTTRGYHVLRYNSRGIGKSSGWPSLTGKQEGEDLRELIDWAVRQYTALSSLVVIGYSHGSLVGSLYFPADALGGIEIFHVLLSYPLGPRAWLTAFRSAHYTAALKNLLHDPRSNVLLLYGDCDNFTDVESYDAWAESLRLEAHGNNCGNLQVKKIEGANHFWVDQDARGSMLRCVQDWVP